MAKSGGPGEPQIQWYPGHMAQAMRKLGERLRVVDVVIEVRDARLPDASANPGLDRLAAHKPRLIVLGCEDLADPHITREWLVWLAAHGRTAVAVNGKDQTSVRRIAAALDTVSAGGGAMRAMVVGIPNTGKSSIINGLVRRTAARAEDKAGVTRSLQWFRVGPKLELMDTDKRPDLPHERAAPDLAGFAQSRGFTQRGGGFDAHNAAGAYLKHFGEGKFGRFSFERPEAAA